MKKVLLFLGILLLVLIMAGGLFLYFKSEPEPEGLKGSEADNLAREMEAAVNKEAWDSTRFVRWTFVGRHTFLWDKENDVVQVLWDDVQVLLHTQTQTGKAFLGGNELSPEESRDYLQKAWEYFCNDSFWLNAAVKAFDPGTQRSVVTLDDGRRGLKVTYTSGGVTPGDSYVWILDEQNRPSSFKMWVKVLPIGGVEFFWEDWQQLSTGAWLATSYRGDAFTVKITDLKGSMSLAEMGMESDPFQQLR